MRCNEHTVALQSENEKRAEPKLKMSSFYKTGIELNHLYTRLWGPARPLCPPETTSIFRSRRDDPKNGHFEKKRFSIGDKINAVSLQRSSAKPSTGYCWRRQYAWQTEFGPSLTKV
jgi:hypothetical protein